MRLFVFIVSFVHSVVEVAKKLSLKCKSEVEIYDKDAQRWTMAVCPDCGLNVQVRHHISDGRKKPSVANLHLGKLLGKGSNGLVYSAVDRTSGRVYAVKDLTVDIDRDLVKGRRLYKDLSKTENPYLAKLWNVINEVQVLEFVHGAGASRFFPNFWGNGIPEQVAKDIITQVFKGLEGFYDSSGLGVVHGDLNMYNIMLEGSVGKPSVKIVDADYCKVG
jgi:serine/threonine protein kinase